MYDGMGTMISLCFMYEVETDWSTSTFSGSSIHIGPISAHLSDLQNTSEASIMISGMNMHKVHDMYVK